jgi:hypothetical protein
MCQSEIIVINQSTGWRKFARCKNFCVTPRWTPNAVPCLESITEYYEKSAIKAGWRYLSGNWYCPSCAKEGFVEVKDVKT